ncbi:MAG: polysaccharide biosynthesis tyrosine autokinase [Alphaproteobacteria bacterium]|nr:polysaccharide biosynthesis tyrosine autokinase [Alphaproteobacteria bacterium]MBU6471842.1 polysaccharide biosynthesis tyrosine autokinase [Alphaproteobacteria bacterium]MDE2012325.1 polysaccharide biosynthesis tyrosine autokinase [Alphaproteobacteria bacterium]MDE2072998.1 polysaccharide biosynthesis tyrosine autokinase [Alphaproteobacteria bacterium]MDE2352069.1 polysaccharide biosynthesis tyrosine autokinase [Alphaproteobacteria bacterium]
MNQREELPLAYAMPPEPDGDDFDLGRLIGAVSEARWLVLGIATAVLALGTLYAFLRTPIYETSTDLLVLTQQSGGLSGLEELSSMLQGSALPTQTEIQLMQTRSVLVPVISQLHLDIAVSYGGWPILGPLLGWQDRPDVEVSRFEVPAALEGDAFEVVPLEGGRYRLLDPNGQVVLEGVAGKTAAAKVQTDDGFGIVILRIAHIGPDVGAFALTKLPMNQVVAQIRDSLNVSELGLQTGIVQAKLRGTSPTLITRELNAIAQTNVEGNARRSALQAGKQLQFLKARLPDIERQVQKAQKALSDFLSDHRTLVFAQDTTYLTQRGSQLEQQIGPLEAQLAEARVALGAQNPEIGVLQAQLAELTKRRDELYAGVSKLPKDQQTLIRLQSDATTAQSLYQAVLNQTQTLQVAQAGAVGDVVIVDTAELPTKPVFPRRLLVMAGSLVLGLFLGLGTAVARRTLFEGVEDPEVLDRVLGLPVHAVIPHSDRQERIERGRLPLVPDEPRLLAAQKFPDDAASEGLRSLRTSLQLTLPQGSPHILCLTSLGPGEGKSFVASNLSYLSCQGGQRVLLVDADLRRGHLHKVFGLERGPGLAEVLAGKAGVEDVIHHVGGSHLGVLTTGALPDDPAELLLACDLAPIMAKLRAAYDLVIIEVPPVLAVSDAFVLARHATLCLLLLKYGAHNERQIELTKKRFERHNITLLGSVLNDVSVAARRYAYHQYGYQYHYQYHRGDGTEDVSRTFWQRTKSLLWKRHRSRIKRSGGA